MPGAGGEKKFDDARPRRSRPDGDAAGGGAGAGAEGGYGQKADRNEEGTEGVKKDTRGKKWETAGRAAPGAALAAAKREKVGIVEGTGSKIVFD